MPSTDEGTDASRGHPGKPGDPPQAWPASRVGMAELRVYKSHCFLDIYFHFVAVDKQHPVSSLYHSEHPHASQPASLIIPLDGFPGRELPTESKGKPVFKTPHPLSQPGLASAISGFLSHSVWSPGLVGRLQPSLHPWTWCNLYPDISGLPCSAGWGCTEATGKQGCEGLCLSQHTVRCIMNE